jgi:UDP:flavonoid glycosyltransferase YjiC (YdhE family)
VQQVLPQVFPAMVNSSVWWAAEHPDTLSIGAVEFRPYVPAEAVLAQCDWALCHGGQNTIIQALRREVPLLIFPGAIFERRFNAQKVRAVGAGLMGEVNEFTVDWLRTALTQQAECACHAAQLGARIRSYGGAPAAVMAIENWWKAKKQTHA